MTKKHMNYTQFLKYSSYFFIIPKKVFTKTKIKVLKENEVIEEIARISSGEINEATLKYAK